MTEGKKTLLVGYKGNMGQRYAAILDFLDEKWIGVDVGSPEVDPSLYDKVLIATPTETHQELIHKYWNKPMLCEKPISKNSDFIKYLWDMRHSVNLRVVNQYKWLTNDRNDGITYYHYFKSGRDGLYWDCFNIIGLAKSSAILSNDSPVWLCKINGHRLSLGDMDAAYVAMIQQWLMDFDLRDEYEMEYIVKTTEKVIGLIKQDEKISNRDSSALNQ